MCKVIVKVYTASGQQLHDSLRDFIKGFANRHALTFHSDPLQPPTNGTQISLSPRNAQNMDQLEKDLREKLQRLLKLTPNVRGAPFDINAIH